MNQKPQKKAELVFVYNGKASTVDKGSWPVMCWKRNQLKNAPQFARGLLQVRNEGAKEFQPVLTKKL